MSLSRRLKSLRKPMAESWGNAASLALMRLLAWLPLPAAQSPSPPAGEGLGTQ